MDKELDNVYKKKNALKGVLDGLFRKYPDKTAKKHKVLERTVLSPNPFTRWFSRNKINKALTLANLNQDDTILDYGCGGGWISMTNSHLSIHAYDIDPTLTEIQTYNQLKPNKILMLDVLEHMLKSDIISLIKEFKQMSNQFDLIVTIPIEGHLWKLMRSAVGKPISIPEHITTLSEILTILSKELLLFENQKFVNMTYIAKYRWVK